MSNANPTLHDTSELNVSLQRIKDCMEYLHCELDPFTSRSTNELKGHQKRAALYQGLYEIDVELGVIDRIRSPQLPELTRHVTTRMKKNILKLKLLVASLCHLLNPITHRLGDDADKARSNLKQLRKAIDDLIHDVILEAEQPAIRTAIEEAIEDLDYGHDEALKEAIGWLEIPEPPWVEIVARLTDGVETSGAAESPAA